MFTGSEDMDVLIEGYYSTDYKGHQWSRRPREESHMDTHMRTQIHECKQSLMPIFLCYSNWCGFCLHNWSVTEPATSRSSSPQLCWGISSHDVIWQLRWVTRRCDACILCEMLTAGQSAHPHLTQLCWCVCACLCVCLCVCVCVHGFATSTFRKFQVYITVLLTLVTISSLELLCLITESL